MNFPVSAALHRQAARVGRLATEGSQPAFEVAAAYKRHAGCCLTAKAGLPAQRHSLDELLSSSLVPAHLFGGLRGVS